MRGINCAMRSAMLGGMILVLSASPALASGENKMLNEKAKVEINKVEKNMDEKEMREEKKVGEKLGVLRINKLGIHRLNLLLDEDILEDILGEELEEELEEIHGIED